MKCMIITYISVPHALADVESMMGYYNFNAIESHEGYRVFTGYFSGNLRHFVQKLNNQLDAVEFAVEDSMFIVYPVLSDNGHASISNVIIKRKGNKFLRNRFMG